MTRPSTPSTAAAPLFSLPKIPYYFTITPYPLSCQGLQTSSSLESSPKRMKRRFNADARNSRGDGNPPNLLSDQTPSLSAVGQQVHSGSAQNTLLTQHGGVGFAYVDSGSPEERDSGPESIDGRVLKRMRLIKLDSMSPPADVPQSPQSDSLRLSPTISDEGQGSFNTGSMKRISPVRISTRSTVPLESIERSVLNQVSNPIENIDYSGMNVLLHQIHASRFGIPDEDDLGNHSLYHQQQQQQRRTSHQQQQQQLHHQHHQQQQRQHQLLQQHQARVNTGIPIYMTTWHQPPAHTTGLENEDDEMTDVEEQVTISGVSQINFSSLQAQPPGYILTQSQQHSTPQAFALPNHATSVQAQQQQHHQQTYQPQGPNHYQDINAQLRAAFLARAEMEQRYR